jgi:hypothetical protein
MIEMAEALVSSGMADAGYDTINVVCNGTSTSCVRKEWAVWQQHYTPQAVARACQIKGSAAAMSHFV